MGIKGLKRFEKETNLFFWKSVYFSVFIQNNWNALSKGLPEGILKNTYICWSTERKQLGLD